MNIVMPTSAADAYRSRMGDVAALAAAGCLVQMPHDRVVEARIAVSVEAAMASIVTAPDDDPQWARDFLHAPDVKKRELYRNSPSAFAIAQIERLFKSAGDDVCRWALIAQAWVDGDPAFGMEYLEPLGELDARNLRWLVAGAAWVKATAGADTTISLKLALDRLARKIRNFEAVLSTMAASPDAHQRLMGQLALAVRRGSNVSSLYTHSMRPMA